MVTVSALRPNEVAKPLDLLFTPDTPETLESMVPTEMLHDDAPNDAFMSQLTMEQMCLMASSC